MKVLLSFDGVCHARGVPNGSSCVTRIPEIIRASGTEPEVRILKGAPLVEALFEKLTEESEELRMAAQDEQVEELADVFEVLRGLALHLGIDFATLRTQR